MKNEDISRRFRKGKANRDWFEKNSEELTRTHPNKYVVVWDKNILLVADTWDEAFALAKNSDIKDEDFSVTIFHVPFPINHCQHCGKGGRELISWTGELDSINQIRMMGRHPKWCDECTVSAQLDYARRESKKQMERIPVLENELKEIKEKYWN